MTIRDIELLSFEKYQKYAHLIPDASCSWWLCTPGYHPENVFFVSPRGTAYGHALCYNSHIGIRPFCIFNLELADSLFWCKPKVLAGSKIKYGKYSWTVLDVQNGKLYALCDGLITKRRFDEKVNIWEESELRVWLKTKGLKSITTKRR